MEINKSLNTEPNRPFSGSTGTGGAPGTEARRQERETSDLRETGKEMLNRGAEMYGQTKEAISQAYDRTADAASKTYDQAVTYGKENPGKLTLIAFGAGIGIGLLLAGTGRRPRNGRYAEPIVTALSDIALEFFRHR